MNVWTELAIVVALTVLNGFFAMSEMAMVGSRRFRLQHLTRSGNAGAARALKLAENPSRFISVVQVGMTGIGILSGAFGGATLGLRLGDALEQVPWLQPRGHEIAVAIVVVGITGLTLIVGELVPKRIALAYPERIASAVAHPLEIVIVVARPLVWLLENTAALALRLLAIPERSAHAITEEDVKLFVAEGTRTGAIEHVEQQMIHGVLELANTAVTAVMTPRPNIFWIDLDDDPATIAQRIGECPYLRIVVAHGANLGRPVGVVQKKDLVADLIGGLGINLERHLREPIYVPENMTVLRLLEMFRSVPVHVAFVVDEYGDFLGVATLTDVMEAIAGDLPHEHQAQAQEISQRADGSWLVDGRAPIDELAARLGLTLSAADFHTAAGLALDRLARIPAEKDRFPIGDWQVEIIDMDGKRIDKLLFIPPCNAGAPDVT